MRYSVMISLYFAAVYFLSVDSAQGKPMHDPLASSNDPFQAFGFRGEVEATKIPGGSPPIVLSRVRRAIGRQGPRKLMQERPKGHCVNNNQCIGKRICSEFGFCTNPKRQIYYEDLYDDY